MLSTLLAFFLVWVLYLWLDRQRLRRLVIPKPSPPRQTYKPPKPSPPRQAYKPPKPKLTPSKPKFLNSTPNQKPTSSRNAQSQRFFDAVTGQSPPPRFESGSSPQPEINLNAIQRESVKRKEETRKVSVKTQNDLYRLVRGDRGTVERLIKYSRARYPDKSEQWIWEKAIQDLERDRGYR